MNAPIIAVTKNRDQAKYIRRKNTLGHTERKQLIKEVGIHCLVLFEYYLRLASTEHAVISDEDAGDYFGWSSGTAKRHRLALVKAGWLAIEKARLNNGCRICVHYLGKDEVKAAGLKPETKKKSPPSPL